MSDISHPMSQSPFASSLVLLDSGAPEAPETGKHYLLQQQQVMIGAADDCDIQMPSSVMLPHHAKLQYQDGTWWLFSLVQDNSVCVQNIPSSSCSLDVDGQTFQIGKAVFKFLLGQGYESKCFSELYRRDVTDFLTNVYNKRYFSDMLDKEITRAKRYERSLAFLMVDLDEFGKINKTLGQLAGDSVLKEAARRMQDCMRTHDVLGRIGGEEFAVILPETTMAQAREVAERLRVALHRTPCIVDGKEVPISLSAGLCVLVKPMEAKDLMQRANELLHQAKQKGRNRVESQE